MKFNVSLNAKTHNLLLNLTQSEEEARKLFD